MKPGKTSVVYCHIMIRNQQVVCSSHIASSKKKPHRKAVFRVPARFYFCLKLEFVSNVLVTAKIKNYKRSYNLLWQL